MKRWILLALAGAALFLMGAKTQETVSTWKTIAYRVTTTVGSGKVRVVFIEKNMDNSDVDRCGQQITSARARDLSADLTAAAADADAAP